MSDSQPTPLRSARVNSERFDTELAAVWYAANYYYEASFRRGGEYIGVVFKETADDGKYGITVRGDGGFAGAKVKIGDVPADTLPTAVWHTHVPSTSGHTTTAEKIFLLLMTGFDAGWDQFSPEDQTLSDKASKVSLKRWGYRIPIYLITATQIKRYKGADHPIRIWAKDPPSHMRK